MPPRPHPAPLVGAKSHYFQKSEMGVSPNHKFMPLFCCKKWHSISTAKQIGEGPTPMSNSKRSYSGLPYRDTLLVSLRQFSGIRLGTSWSSGNISGEYPDLCVYLKHHPELISSVMSSNSHPDLLLTHPLFQIPPVLNSGLSLSEPLQLYKGYDAI